jgi:regulator of protease activity HflC (stomatin/prohibitin superfamily)
MHGISRVNEVAREIERRNGQNELLRNLGSTSANLSTKPDPTMGEPKMFYFKHFVREHERALLFRDREFVKFLVPGVYRFPYLFHRYTVERFDVTVPAFGHRLQDFLIEKHRDAVERLFDIVATGADEIAVVYHNDRVTAVMGPANRRLFTKGVFDMRVDRYEVIDELVVDKRLARKVIAGKDPDLKAIADKYVITRLVPEGHVGILYVDGELERMLESGFHAFFNVERAVAISTYDTRIQSLEVSGQEILTKDKVSVRVNVTATYKIADAHKAVMSAENPLDYLYKEVQFGLRGAVGTRTLDELLEDKTAIDRSVAEFLTERFADIGITVAGVGVKDIILPGDMKELLGKVVEAEKVAQANVIRRREETNATRSLLNTAKVMESNAVALRLKELETLEKITEKIGNISVYGGLDSVLNDLVRMKQ